MNILKIFYTLLVVALPLLFSCGFGGGSFDNILVTYEVDTIGSLTEQIVSERDIFKDSIGATEPGIATNDTVQQQPIMAKWGKNYPANDIVSFAKTLMGTPYLYGSTDPAAGFDCSGFITYVFTHFGLKVPRSSVEFTNRGVEVPVNNAAPGDLILFRGTDSLSTIVGHMGIVIENADSLKFIHSSSGKANGVTVSPLQGYYEKRFVKVISVKNGI